MDRLVPADLADHLSFMAGVDPKDIPQSRLLPGPSRKETDAIGTQDAYPFIKKRNGGQFFDMHRLVYLTARGWLKRNLELSGWHRKAIVRLKRITYRH